MFPHAKIFISRIEADAMDLKGENIVRVDFTDGSYKNFEKSQKISEGIVMLPAYGHTNGNSIAVAEVGDTYYMFGGDVTYNDVALKKNELSVVFENIELARKTLDKVREFIINNPTIYLTTHTPEALESLKENTIMKL